MSAEIENEIYDVLRAIMKIADRIDQKAKEAKSAEIQKSLKDLLESFQKELGKGIKESTELLDTLSNQKNDIQKLETLSDQVVTKETEVPEVQGLNKKAVLKEAREEMARAKFQPEAIDKTLGAIEKTFDELSKVLDPKAVMKEAKSQMIAQGVSKDVMEKASQAIGTAFEFEMVEREDKAKDLSKSPEREVQKKAGPGQTENSPTLASNLNTEKLDRVEQIDQEIEDLKKQRDNELRKNVTQNAPRSPVENVKIELQSKPLTKAEFMDRFSEELKTLNLKKGEQAQIKGIMDSVTDKVLSPDYGKPVDWAVAKSANRNEAIQNFKEFVNSRKDLVGKGRLDTVIKEAREKTVEKQRNTLEQRRQRGQQYKQQPQTRAR